MCALGVNCVWENEGYNVIQSDLRVTLRVASSSVSESCVGFITESVAGVGNRVEADRPKTYLEYLLMCRQTTSMFYRKH